MLPGILTAALVLIVIFAGIAGSSGSIGEIVAFRAQLVEYVLAPVGIAFAIGSYINQAAPGVPVIAVAVVSYAVFTTVNIVGVKLSAGFELILTVVAVIVGIVYGLIFVLANFVDPKPREMTLTIQPDKFLKK